MNYKLVILLLFLFLVCSLQSIQKIKGANDEAKEEIKLHVSLLDVNVSILMNESACVSAPEYCVGDVVNVTSKLTNAGNINATGNLITRISNRINYIHNETWNDVNVSEGQIEYYSTIYKIQNSDVDYSLVGPETFNVRSNYSFNGRFNESICNFEVKKGIGTLQSFPFQIIDIISPGRTKFYSPGIQLLLYKACKGTNVTLNTTLGIPGEWVSFSNNKIYLVPDSFNSTDINITIPPNTKEGIYDNGSIFAYADGQGREIKLNITVAMIDFDLNVTIQEKKVCPGKTIPASVNITKFNPPEDVRVNITYQILDYNLTVYDEKKEYNLLLGNQPVQKLSTLTVPSSAKTGYYMFLVTLDYNSTLMQVYDLFEVISCAPPITQPSPSKGEETPAIPKEAISAISLNLSTDTLTVIIGNKTSFIASVNNIGTESIKSIKISIEGIPSEWIRIFPTTVDLDVDELEEYLIIINVPTNTTPGIYKLYIKAKDDVESNTEILTLIIGRDPKEIADLLIKELDGVRAEANRSLLVKDCIDITIMKTFYQDAESAFENGMKEYKNNNYEGAANWFEYALPIEKKVVSKVDITLELEIETTNKSKFLVPPFYKPEEQFNLVGIYLQGKNYEKICDPMEKLRKFILIGLVFWPGMVILFIILIILMGILLKRRKEQERAKILERVRERLSTSNG